MRRKNILELCVIGFVVLGSGGSAVGALTQLQVNFDKTFTGRVSWGTGSDSVYLTALQATRIGGDSLPYASATFYSFCVDIATELVSGRWWQSGLLPLNGAANGNDVPYINGGVQRAASLYNQYVTGVNFNNLNGKREGAALQLAIWEVLYDSGAGGYDVRRGAFHVREADSAVTRRANIMLTSPFNVAEYNITSTFWTATDANGNPACNQDLIGAPSVPEPAGYAVAAAISACGYLAGRRVFEKKRNSRRDDACQG